MPGLERIRIQANTIDAAAEKIIGVLEDTSKGNVIYFRGRRGFGASAALKVVARRLKSTKSKFDKVIHVDCLVWKSMRALQKAVAEELELPQSVMAIFDRCDEDDDLNGIEQGSRGVIADISREICRKLLNGRFVLIFHNGSRRYIDFYEVGVPAIPLLGNKVLWTWHGKFRLDLMLDDEEPEKMMMQTNVYLKMMQTNVYIRTSHGYIYEELLWDLVREEVKEVVTCIRIAKPGHMNYNVVKQCVLYVVYGWAQIIFSPTGLVDLDTHGPNYWVCDGIIKVQGNTSAWEIANSLERNISLDWVRKNPEGAKCLSDLLTGNSNVYDDRWVYVTNKKLLQDDTCVLRPGVTSFFVLPDEPPVNTIPALPVSMFQHSRNSKLRVLYLLRCTFSFASPPFLCCSQLRLLHLDHCTNITDDDEHPSYNENISCFQNLWVLDLRYTHWYWLLSEKMKRLMVELRELNVEGVMHGSISDLCGGRPSLVILRVTEAPVHTENKDTNNQSQFLNMSSTNSLTTSSFINNVLPPRIESFSFINKAETAAKISSISFRGCSRLKSILIRGNLGSLEELDLSGTAVKTLDLREMEAPNLKHFILLGCDKLCAILWPPKNKRTRVLEVLRINTITSVLPGQANSKEKTSESYSAKRSSILPVDATQPDIFSCNWYIAVRDARPLRSLEPIRSNFPSDDMHMEMSSSPASRVAVDDSEVAKGIRNILQPGHCLYARDVVFQGHLQAGAGNEGRVSWIWACPPRPTLEALDWYVHVQDEQVMKRGLLQQGQSSIEETSTSAIIPPRFMCAITRTLHVHDSSSITCISCPHGSTWVFLEWCRVERCPNLCSVFATPSNDDANRMLQRLKTFWGSQLLMACYIWNWNPIYRTESYSFWSLVFLHLDYCPRLIHVLPLPEYIGTFPSLETLEIVCCGDLKEVFPLDPKCQEKQEVIEFPELRRIHMYELPTLQQICGTRMSTPNLETVKIRGCWSLKRLPAVSGRSTKRPKVDCEKDWWDNLEWDGVEANHDPSLYKPRHSRYYKKAHLPRGTMLR